MMKRYTTILFDLDGTLTDPGVGITNSVAYALAKWNIMVKDRTELYKFIGPPLKDSFARYYGFNDTECDKAVSAYREYFSATGLFENMVYDGITTMLSELKAAGKKIVLATSKPDEFSIRILKKFELYDYFDFCACATMDEKRTKKDEVISYAFENIAEKDKSKIVMVGDREHDIIGASKCGIDSVGILYGYGQRAEHENAHATYIVKTVDELKKFLLEH